MAFVSVTHDQPLQDARQSEAALSIRRGLQRLFFDMKSATLPELTLANGRRADLMAIDDKGLITIVEIKSSIEDFRVDTKWPDYREFCDLFYFATHSDVPLDIFPADEGLIVADRFGAEILETAKTDKLSPARRKSVTHRFATCAAERLMRAEWVSGGELFRP
jgi:hypothetical protein